MGGHRGCGICLAFYAGLEIPCTADLLNSIHETIEYDFRSLFYPREDRAAQMQERDDTIGILR